MQTWQNIWVSIVVRNENHHSWQLKTNQSKRNITLRKATPNYLTLFPKKTNIMQSKRYDIKSDCILRDTIILDCNSWMTSTFIFLDNRVLACCNYSSHTNYFADHCMVSFVKPNLLGTRKEFTNTFVNPIQNGQCADSTALDVQIMKQRCHVLHKMLEGCVQVSGITCHTY